MIPMFWGWEKGKFNYGQHKQVGGCLIVRVGKVQQEIENVSGIGIQEDRAADENLGFIHIRQWLE